MLSRRQKEYLGGAAVAGALVYYFVTKAQHKTTTTPTTTTTSSATGVTKTVIPVRSSAVAIAKTATGSTTASAKASASRTSQSSGQSPFGTNPALTPRNCPSGYKPRYVQGYGWVCQETTAREIANLKASYLSAGCATGIGFSASGISVGGLTPYQQAQLALATLQGKCGGSWGIYWQQGQYLIIPASRLRYLLSIGASNIYTVSSSGGQGALVRLSTVRSGSSQTPRTTVSVVSTPKRVVQPTIFRQINAALASANLPSNYTGYYRINLGNGNFTDVYINNGAVSSINSAGQPTTIHV